MLNFFNEPKCLEQLSNPLTHPQLCRNGRARIKPHRMVTRSFCRVFETMNVYADEERAVPCLYQIEEDGRVKEAILDVVLSFPGESGLVPFDITIRCPHGEEEVVAAWQPGHAAKLGCLDKDERYGSGCVVPISMETYGRMTQRSCGELRAVCSTAARTNNMSTASGTYRMTGTDAYNKARKALERTLLWEQADTVICCIGHTTTTGAFLSRSVGRNRDGRCGGARCLFPTSATSNSTSLYLAHTGSIVAVNDPDAVANAKAAASEIPVSQPRVFSDPIQEGTVGPERPPAWTSEDGDRDLALAPDPLDAAPPTPPAPSEEDVRLAPEQHTTSQANNIVQNYGPTHHHGLVPSNNQLNDSFLNHDPSPVDTHSHSPSPSVAPYAVRYVTQSNNQNNLPNHDPTNIENSQNSHQYERNNHYVNSHIHHEQYNTYINNNYPNSLPNHQYYGEPGETGHVNEGNDSLEECEFDEAAFAQWAARDTSVYLP